MQDARVETVMFVSLYFHLKLLGKIHVQPALKKVKLIFQVYLEGNAQVSDQEKKGMIGENAKKQNNKQVAFEHQHLACCNFGTPRRQIMIVGLVIQSMEVLKIVLLRTVKKLCGKVAQEKDAFWGESWSSQKWIPIFDEYIMCVYTIYIYIIY